MTITENHLEFAEAWAALWLASRDDAVTLSHRTRLARSRADVSRDDQAAIILRLTKT